MNIVCKALSAILGNRILENRFSLRSRLVILSLAVISLGHAGSVFAVDPPENIRLEDNVLRWDPVENAVNYNIYLLSGPVVDNTVTPLYAATVENPLEFRPTMEGFYTVVTVALGDTGLEFSNVADGETVAFSGSGEGARIVTINDALEIRTVRCDNVVAGGACESQCPLPSRINPTGGACRADTGVVLHQRALINGFECISQSDTSFVEVDVYCLRTNNI